MASILSVEEETPDNNIPWQVKAVGYIGIPGVIAIGLVYILAHEVRTWQEDTSKVLTTHIETTNNAINNSHAESREMVEALRMMQRSLDRVCVNTARGTSAIENCLK